MVTQAERLNAARDNLKRSKRWRDSGHGSNGNSYDETWRRMVDLYQGYHYDAQSGTDQLVVNLVFATMNIMAPAVAIQNPRFVVNARKPESVAQSIITEEVLNYVWQSGHFQDEFRLAVNDWLFCGHGWIKVGWKNIKEPPTETKVDTIPTQNSPSSGDSELSEVGVDDREDDEANFVETERTDLDKDGPFIERISLFDMFVDQDARHPKEMKWIAQRTWRPLADVHADERYSATNRKRVAGTRHSRWSGDDADARDGSDRNPTKGGEPEYSGVQYAEIIEYYDLKRGTVGTFAIDSDAHDNADTGWLIKPKRIPYALGNPFVMLRNHEVPDTFYPVGDIEQIESLQSELNETRTQMFNHRKKFRRAWVYAKDRFDEEGIEALESEDDNVLVPVQGDTDPASALAPVPAVITPPDFYTQSDVISNDLNEVSGVSDYARGTPQQYIRRTATEAAMIQDSANARAQDRLLIIESVLSQIGSHVVALMQQFMTGEQVARVVTLPVRAWVNFNADYIKGEFDFDVRGGSTEPRNETFRRQSAMQLVDAAMPFLEMGVADPAALWIKVLRDGFGEQDAQRFLAQPEPAPEDPMAGAPPPQEQMPPEQGMPPGMPPGMGPMGPPPPAAGPAPGGGGPVELTPELLAMMIAEDQGVTAGEVPAEQFMIPGMP